MPVAPANKVDIVTWLINVQHPHEPETPDHWQNPSRHAVMREVLHESVHFWHAVGTPYFLRVSMGAYWDFQRIRDRAFSQSGGAPIPADRLELEPDRPYFLGYQRLNHRYFELSGADLVEGLARYWDIHLCGMRVALDRLIEEGRTTAEAIDAAQLQSGPFFLPDGVHYTEAALNFVLDHETRYNRAYAFTVDRVGEEAFILFPVLGFLALSTRALNVNNFQRWVTLWAESRPFAVQRGNFLAAWEACFIDAFRWITKELAEEVYSPLTVYRGIAGRMGRWSVRSEVGARFGVMDAHGILDRYLRNYWSWLRAKHPTPPDEDIELRIDPAFCLPGVPGNRDVLTRHFHPPVILFADGDAWLDMENWRAAPGGLTDQLISFGGMLGAAMALSGEFPAAALHVSCPHRQCAWHDTKLCWKVARFPARPEDCTMPALYAEQMNLVLPDDPAWTTARVQRPVLQQHAQLLMTEMDSSSWTMLPDTQTLTLDADGGLP